MKNPLDLAGCMISILAYDPPSQTLGIALASSSIAIGARCPHMVLGKAVVASQGFTNLKVGPLALDLIECGLTAQEVIQALRRHDRWMDYRQIAIVSAKGEIEAHTGPLNTGWAGHVVGENLVCLGNGLPDEEPLEAMKSQYLASSNLPLAEQMLCALETARDTIGPSFPVTSSSLLVRSPEEAEQIDLRVDFPQTAPDDGGDAVRDLRGLYARYRPLADLYAKRSMRPDPM
jgi:uncharacterized Ntn-hydrolase superfamily protein